MENSPVEYGPLKEAIGLSGGLDHYKLTMSQFQYEKEPDAEVTFTFKNRGEQRLADYVDAEDLQTRFNRLREISWSDDELEYFKTIRTSDGSQLITNEYIDFLQSNKLPEIQVQVDTNTSDLAITSTAEWPLVTFWETIVMSEVNEAYFEGYIRNNSIDIMELYEEGAKRLDEKITVLQANPDIKFVNFGTRRHFSLRWHRYVDERLKQECPENFLGTSNLATARELDLVPSGTFAHEMPMVYCGLADSRDENIRAAHGAFLNQWYERFPDYDVALTDTFTTEFFFEDFTKKQAENYQKLRQDSGDPIKFGEKALAYYEANGIDPKTKTIVFSDGLDIDEILRLHNIFKDRINIVFGWGTTLTNDLGIPALSIVMKATCVNGKETVKLSDEPGKHTGSEDKVDEYEKTFNVKDERHECTLTTV